MRRQICRLVIALGCFVGLSGPTMAGPFSCSPGSFLSVLDTGNQILTGSFGEVCVTLTDSTHALIQAATNSPYLMFGAGMLGLQVNSTNFDIVGGAGGITGGTSASYSIAFPGSSEDGFGKFDLSLTNFDGPGSGTSFLTFSLVNNVAGGWSSVSSVLAANASGYDAAMQIADCTEVCGGAGFAAELYSNGRIVPQPAPEPGTLGLLGMALLAWGLPALRRRKA